jgi:hypothetical protein
MGKIPFWSTSLISSEARGHWGCSAAAAKWRARSVALSTVLRVLRALYPVVLGGCLVADPPQYEAPKRTPPIFNLNETTPYVGDIIVYRDNSQTIDFNVKFRSEDQGAKVVGVVHVDYGFVSLAASYQQQTASAPSSLDDTSRSLSWSWSNDRAVSSGCHQFMLIAAHEDSYPLLNSFRPDPELAKDDIAIATWWVNVTPSGDPYTLQHCPNRAEVQQ